MAWPRVHGTGTSLTLHLPVPRWPPGAAFTPVVPRSYDPLFADTRAFPLSPTAALLTGLASNPLHLVVCDDAVPVDPVSDYAAPAAPARMGALVPSATLDGSRALAAGAHRAVLGVATVSLARVAEGMEQEGTYEVCDERGGRVGSITVR